MATDITVNLTPAVALGVTVQASGPPGPQGTVATALRHWLDETIGKEDSAVVTYNDLVQWWRTDERRLTRRTVNTIATPLDKIGIGIDPDRLDPPIGWA